MIAVCGAGSWGIALAHTLGAAGSDVVLWARTNDSATTLQQTRSLAPYFDSSLDPRVTVTADISAIASAGLIMMAIPTHAMRSVAINAAPFLRDDAIVVSAAKGFEPETDSTMTEVLSNVVAQGVGVAVVSGPNLAPEIVAGLPAATVVAASRPEVAASVRDTCSNTRLRWYSSTDVVGVEYAGALKNVVAIAAGVCDGLGLGSNAKAAVITRGLAEMARLGMRAGADPLTFSGLAGIGDCMATCMSPLSRNRSLGEAIARGSSVEEVLHRSPMVVEGVSACDVALRLATRYGVEMPIAQAVHDLLFSGRSLGDVMSELMARDPSHEGA